MGHCSRPPILLRLWLNTRQFQELLVIIILHKYPMTTASKRMSTTSAAAAAVLSKKREIIRKKFIQMSVHGPLLISLINWFSTVMVQSWQAGLTAEQENIISDHPIGDIQSNPSSLTPRSKYKIHKLCVLKRHELSIENYRKNQLRVVVVVVL